MPNKITLHLSYKMYFKLQILLIKNVVSVRGRKGTSYISPVTLICDRVLNYIGVQMALPFLKDKKSGVMKSALETSYAILTRTIRPASGNTPKSRKSVLICLESTTLQLGAGGETA